MSRTLRCGGEDYRLLDGWGTAPPGGEVRFPDVLSARRFVERLLFSPDNEETLRRSLQERRGPFGARVEEYRLADELARLLWSGDIRIEVIRHAVLAAGLGGASQAEETRPEAPVRETSWVEFVVLDDAKGVPVPNVKLGITLPEKKRAEHTTPANGTLDFDPCERGFCLVESDLEDATIGETLELVGFGDPSGEPLAGTPFPNDKKRPFKLAHVRRHRVRSTDTLKSIAERAGMTWQALAKFNFGTDAPEEVNRALHLRVGCWRRTEDKKNYVFSDDDYPGIVYVPEKVRHSGLSVGRAHTLRVRRITRPYRPFVFSY